MKWDVCCPQHRTTQQNKEINLLLGLLVVRIVSTGSEVPWGKGLGSGTDVHAVSRDDPLGRVHGQLHAQCLLSRHSGRAVEGQHDCHLGAVLGDQRSALLSADRLTGRDKQRQADRRL